MIEHTAMTLHFGKNRGRMTDSGNVSMHPSARLRLTKKSERRGVTFERIIGPVEEIRSRKDCGEPRIYPGRRESRQAGTLYFCFWNGIEYSLVGCTELNPIMPAPLSTAADLTPVSTSDGSVRR